ALALAPQRAAHVAHVAQGERCAVDQRAAALLGQDLERGDRGGRERLAYRAGERLVVGRGPELGVLEHELDARSHALEARELLVADGAAAEPRLHVAQPGRERRQEEEILAQPARRDLDEQPTL